jgi:nicotinamidase-related amidase
MMKALVVIDVQKAMFDTPGFVPLDGEAVVDRIASLIADAREAGTPIFFVQHDGGPDDPFHAGKPGFPFHDKLTPRIDDNVTVKHHGSAFNGTDLDANLKKANVDTVVICGMQSEYCVDSAVRGAVERGYKVILVADGHTTFDTKILKAENITAHENETLGGSYAEVMPAAQIVFSS